MIFFTIDLKMIFVCVQESKLFYSLSRLKAQILLKNHLKFVQHLIIEFTMHLLKVSFNIVHFIVKKILHSKQAAFLFSSAQRNIIACHY